MDTFVPGTPLPFEKTENFRQLGGYTGADGRRVKCGQIYRSGALADAVRTPTTRRCWKAWGCAAFLISVLPRSGLFCLTRPCPAPGSLTSPPWSAPTARRSTLILPPFSP